MAKRDLNANRLSTASTHLDSAQRNYDAAKSAEARGDGKAVQKALHGAQLHENWAGNAIDAAYKSIVSKKK